MLPRHPHPSRGAALEPFADEGFGEVQTPLQVRWDPLRPSLTGAEGTGASTAAERPSPTALSIGDVVLCRPAKAGEISERFTSAVLLSGGGSAAAALRVVGRAQTYRGLGQCFF
jgi:hypothetical protein